MKKTILIWIIGLSLLAAFVFSQVLNTATFKDFTGQEVIGASMKYKLDEIEITKHAISETEYLLEVKIPSINFIQVDYYTEKDKLSFWELVFIVQEQQAEYDELRTRLEIIESKLNITYIEPEEDSLPLYRCEADDLTKECLGGISGGKNTRCYNGINPLGNWLTGWKSCSEGWVLI